MNENVLDPYAVLSIGLDATDEEVRAAWLAAVRAHPPDRDPEGFRRVRAAYDLVSDAKVRLERRLFGRPELSSLSDLSRLFDSEPVRVEAALWKAALRERDS